MPSSADQITTEDRDINLLYNILHGTPGSPVSNLQQSSVALHVSPTGNDSNNGQSWAGAKLTFLAAYDALPASGGTIYVADNTAIGGTVANQGLWLIGPNDPNYAAPPSGWRVAKPLRVVGMGSNISQFSKQPQATLTWGSASDSAKPAIWIAGWAGGAIMFENLNFIYPAVAWRLGVSSANTANGALTAGISFRRCNASTLAGGPVVDIKNCFWAYFKECAFLASQTAAVTSDQRASILVKPGANDNTTGYLIFVDNCISGFGGIIYYQGNFSWQISVKDFVTENAVRAAVWFKSTNGFGNAHLESIQMADNTEVTKDTVLIEGSGPTEAVEAHNCQDVNGPALVTGTYPGFLGTKVLTLNGAGQIGFQAGKVGGQHDAARRNFGLTVARFTNLVNQDYATGWTNTSGGTSRTTAQAGPDGASNAVLIATSDASTQGANAYRANRTFAVGDWLVFGGWVQATSGTLSTVPPVILIVNTAGFTFTSSGTSNVSVNAPVGGDGQWEFVWTCQKIATIGTNPCDTVCRLQVTTASSRNWFQPAFYHLANTVSQNEAFEFAINFLPSHNLATAGTYYATRLLVGANGVSTKTKAGTPSDADFAVTPPDGTMVADTSANKVWVRVGGAWKFAALT